MMDAAAADEYYSRVFEVRCCMGFSHSRAAPCPRYVELMGCCTMNAIALLPSFLLGDAARRGRAKTARHALDCRLIMRLTTKTNTQAALPYESWLGRVPPPQQQQSWQAAAAPSAPPCPASGSKTNKSGSSSAPAAQNAAAAAAAPHSSMRARQSERPLLAKLISRGGAGGGGLAGSDDEECSERWPWLARDRRDAQGRRAGAGAASSWGCCSCLACVNADANFTTFRHEHLHAPLLSETKASRASTRPRCTSPRRRSSP
jgi:hypothetical protein